MYQNPYNQIQQYQPHYQQQQNFMPNQNQGIVGRIVDSDTDITVNDVPMNGQPAIFPNRDMSSIEVRQWNANGQISTMTYKPVEIEQTEEHKCKCSEKQNEALQSLTEAFENNFADINARFDKLEKALAGTKSTSRAKKEVDKDE